MAQVPGATGSVDWREVVENREVDAVLIALPAHLQAEAAVAAFAAGKHVYLEKPIAATLYDGRRIIDAWRESECIGATGFNYRFHPLIDELRQQIRSQRIGQVIAVRGTFTTTDRDLPVWKLSRATGGGALLDLASHHIDLLRFALGAEVESVSARIFSLQSEADAATIDLRLSGNIAAQLLVSLRSGDENRIEVFGRKGKLAVDCYRSAEVESSGLQPTGAVGQLVKQSIATVKHVLQSRRSGSHMQRSYERSLDAFISAVSNGKQSACDLKAGYASLAVIDAAERSAHTGQAEIPEHSAIETAPTRAILPADPDLPSLTVIAVTMDCYDSLRRTVRHLAAQTIHPRIELLICGPSRAELQLDEREMQPFHSYRTFESGHGRNIAAVRTPMVHAARAPVVIFAEDHSFPEPTWAEELIAAHAQGAMAAGPQIRNANPQSMMSWADLFLGFGPWVEPRGAGPITRLPWHNSGYDRALLVSYGDQLQHMLENEGLLHARLRAEGKQMYLLQAKTRHVNITRPQSYCSANYHGGRAFGAGRARDEQWNLLRRCVHIGGAPLVPLMRLRASVNEVKECGRAAELLPRMLPALFLGLCCHALGEAVGIAFGQGQSVRRHSDLEFHRERHVSAADAIALGFASGRAKGAGS